MSPLSCLIAKFHYTGQHGPARTFFAARVSEKVRAGPRGSGRAHVVEFSLKPAADQVDRIRLK